MPKPRLKVELKKRGGARPGSGRPPAPPEVKSRCRTITLTGAEWAIVDALCSGDRSTARYIALAHLSELERITPSRLIAFAISRLVDDLDRN